MHQYLALLALPSFAAIGKIVVFLVMLSVLVVLHEFGHFIVARWNHVRVNDFALGMGPTLLKWTSPRSGTNYRLNLFPIGGYCAMQGEDGKTNEAVQQRRFLAEGESEEDGNFQAKSPVRRLGNRRSRSDRELHGCVRLVVCCCDRFREHGRNDDRRGVAA